MRLWHWKLIPVLPRQQLLGQWRECCLIAKNIQEQGTPNHILVDPIMSYSDYDFISFAKRVANEMNNRGYRVNRESFTRYMPNGEERWKTCTNYLDDDWPPFDFWHTDKYFKQCYYNLEEKYDRGGISDEEWKPIQKMFEEETK